ncbi:MAG: epoxyqueuosine reductase QueH [Peptococcaceae bacterium]|nr:epoxyqueuosine reductase QueH [Peptococcaceae bacterium]
MKLLLHTCCGPCSIYPVEVLRKDMEVTGYFFNPNIHPYTEWKARKETLAGYAGAIGLPVIFDHRYLLEEFIRGVVHRETERCAFCYAMRLKRTAAVAGEKNFDAFSTTLLVSPYQKHDLIREIGEAVAAETGIQFIYRDFRPGYKEATARSRELGMYRQKYCGCIYSEKDRYYRSVDGRSGS